MLAAWPAKPSDSKERSTRALVQQYPRRFLKNGILRRGQADQHRGSLEQLILPSSLRPDVQERSGTTSADATGALRCHALGKRKGICLYDAWYGRSVMPCVCMLMALRVLNLCKLSGIGLDLACNVTVLLFLVYTLHGSSHYDLACFLLHGPVVC